MNEITTLIWLTHPAALNDAITAYQDGTPINDAADEVLAALYTDDTFNHYTDEQLLAAITLVIQEN